MWVLGVVFMILCMNKAKWLCDLTVSTTLNGMVYKCVYPYTPAEVYECVYALPVFI